MRTTAEAEKPVELPDDAFAGFDNMTKRLLPEAEGPGSADDKRSEGEACVLHVDCRAGCHV